MKATPIPAETAPDYPAARGRSLRLAAFLAWGIVLCAAFWGPLRLLAGYSAENSLHSHILLVPFISGYLLWIQRDTLPRTVRTSVIPGVLMLVLGIVAFGFASRMQAALSAGDFLALMAFAFVTLLISGGFFFLGRAWVWAACFPIAFLYFLIPLPEAAVHWTETMLKLGSAEAAALLFGLSGTPLLRDGVVFQLSNITLEVAQECSGIRSSWVLFITSVVASFVLLKSPWRRAVLIAVVIPLAILRNGFRILVIGLLCVHYGPHMIHSQIHENGGPIFFGLSLLPLFLLLWWLRKKEVRVPFQK